MHLLSNTTIWWISHLCMVNVTYIQPDANQHSTLIATPVPAATTPSLQTPGEPTRRGFHKLSGYIELQTRTLKMWDPHPTTLDTTNTATLRKTSLPD